MIGKSDVEQAYKIIKKYVIETPLVRSPLLSEITSSEVYLKLENMQRTGSFKERGALNYLLTRDNNLRPVVAASAGNHAQAIALHANKLGVKATIFMPENTPNIKILTTQKLGADVKLIGKNYDEAFKAASKFTNANGAEYIHAYNDPKVIAGQGTIALEIDRKNLEPNFILVPVGGGGLISGIASFFEKKSGPKIIGIESSNFRKKNNLFKSVSLAEGIAVKSIGTIAKTICEAKKIEIYGVDDFEIEKAIMFSLEKLKIVCEGAGAAAIAGLFKLNKRLIKNKKIILIISGGNININLLAKLMGRELIRSHRLCRFSAVIQDSPGSLTNLLSLVTACSANLVDVVHERSFGLVNWYEVFVTITAEIKNASHQELMLDTLKKNGYKVACLGLEGINDDRI